TDNGQVVVASFAASEVLALAPGESWSKEVRFVVPKYLDGAYEVWATSRTSGGDMYALAKVDDVVFVGEKPQIEIVPGTCSVYVAGDDSMFAPYQGIDVHAEETLQMECVVVNHT